MAGSKFWVSQHLQMTARVMRTQAGAGKTGGHGTSLQSLPLPIEISDQTSRLVGTVWAALTSAEFL